MDTTLIPVVWWATVTVCVALLVYLLTEWLEMEHRHRTYDTDT